MFSWMRLLGIQLNEAEFFVGHLRTKDGDSLWISAKNILFNIVFKAAQATLDNSSILKVLNDQWKKNTILLYISKYYYLKAGNSGNHIVFKILIADALSRKAYVKNSHLILGLSPGFSMELFEDIVENINLHTYSTNTYTFKNTRLAILLMLIFVKFKRIIIEITHKFNQSNTVGNISKPGILLSQEDDVSLDRSYRGQPHWLFKDSKVPQFRTIILESNSRRFNSPDQNELKKYNLYSVPKDALYRRPINHHIQKTLNESIWRLLKQSYKEYKNTSSVNFQISLLMVKGSLLADFCIRSNIKAFMTCENYFLDADAMNLVGHGIGVHTLSYQYSNLSEVGPIMLTTADTMFTFSKLFHKRWHQNSIHPNRFEDTGYLYDSSFKLLNERALELRKVLKNNGAEFIITYYDESVQLKNNKYGLISEEDHYREISSLLEFVNSNRKIAVIIKSQFQSNSPSIIFGDKLPIKHAMQTGRWYEYSHGKHRNIVFPAEAAIASDIVIGHAVGATAGLEASIAGSRCILLNPYEMRGDNIDIFKKQNILYNDIESALGAIEHYRDGVKEYMNLGEWKNIINLFDSVRDGKSAQRIRKRLEQILYFNE